ncbi:MAG: glutamate--cysteine ligase [Cellvibrio sp.]|nr:glutamate--cysteine ligase [Cellvibrio sp.]
MTGFSLAFSQTKDLFKQAATNVSLCEILRGLEKESLRITPQGTLAKTPHPSTLGSALTHPKITTDYSEALLEFITPPLKDTKNLLNELNRIHRYTFAQIDSQKEMLWPSSMPCQLGKDDEIPVAQYGSSNSGKMKTVYRLGLGHRYGRSMQTIAGIHYNFSLPDSFWKALNDLHQPKSDESLQDFKTRGYFALIRNFRRYFWLLIYLFGASPAVCSCFINNRQHQLKLFPSAGHTHYLPFATSLRMGDLGYQSDAQKKLAVNYNNIQDYLRTLCHAITETHPAYSAIGLKDQEGHYQQLNDSLLQIENEFYSSIRPKRTTQRGETALQALRLRGVEYIEVRCVDLNPYEPLGITETQIQLMDAFLLYCVLSPSPETDEQEFYQGQENQRRIVNTGREPGLQLLRGENQVFMKDWALEILQDCLHCAELLDQSANSQSYQSAVREQINKIHQPESTPSAKILREMQEQKKSFYEYTHALAEQHAKYFSQQPLADDLLQEYTKLAEESLKEQAALEDNQTMSFDEYLQGYFAQYQACQCC